MLWSSVCDLVPGRLRSNELVIGGRAIRIAVDGAHGQINEIRLRRIEDHELGTAKTAKDSVDLVQEAYILRTSSPADQRKLPRSTPAKVAKAAPCSLRHMEQ